ncbi:unnamed protein product [Adineta ricciae]|uniref:Uncharacterized protein n=1 Tax=Adineta ricciae TaxID=249248 RepID=A0A816C3Z4_ADIRI|nr:unnamed protein product [Adineta ricciae]
MKILVPIVGIGIVLTVVTFAIAVTTLVKVNQGFDDIQSNGPQTTPSPTIRPTNPGTTNTNTPGPTTTANTAITSMTSNRPTNDAILPQEIDIQNVMGHLNALQKIADSGNGTRAVDTTGFNQTLDYIVDTLQKKTNFRITRSYFPVRRFELDGDPVFSSSINNIYMTTYNYSSNIAESDYTVARYSTSVNFQDPVELVVIPNLGCDSVDWDNAKPSVDGKVVLVERGVCGFTDKAEFAMKYNATAILIYNHGNTENDVKPITINLGQRNQIPALFLSNTIGEQLLAASQDPMNNITVNISIAIRNESPAPVGNICADTPEGDPTQTILLGSHSDSVSAGPGINDNGSGSAANLEIALVLAKLYNNTMYKKYNYRVRFCWWGAEELGLLGSQDHASKAKNATIPGERLTDYLVNLNYDMLASPNFIFGIYDDKTANNDTPAYALPGCKNINELFSHWFTDQQLPWTETPLNGRSDYGPFLAEGIVSGGLFSGAESRKSVVERNYYDQILGTGLGGLYDTPYDSCYHKACDSIHNINVFAYARMVQAAAYALEYLGTHQNLTGYLYPAGRPTRSDDATSRQDYDSINEYFGLPYF